MATPRNTTFIAASGATVRMGVGSAAEPPEQNMPVITLNPASATVTEPAGATFTAAASWQEVANWQMTTPPGVDFVDIPGAISSNYSTGPTEDATDNGRQFRLRATNAYGTAYSAPAVLTVQAAGVAPVITLSPSAAAVTEPAAATFVAAVTGAEAVNWQRTTPPSTSFVDIAGATSSSYTTGATEDTIDNGRQFRLRATNSYGTSYSAPATLSVSAAVPVVPSSGIVQYLTHDGDAVGNTVTSSAPNRLYWNTVLEVPWSRGVLGDWRDANQSANGSAPYSSFPVITAIGRRTVSVTSLVQRWMSSGINRGFFLAARSNAFPLVFAGRTAAATGDRPELVVVTSAGTFNIAARANACWNSSSVSVVSSSAQWELRGGQQPAILQFPLASVTGTLISATLGVTLTALTQTGAIVDVFEADPPAIYDPAVPVGAVQGIGSGGDFDDLRTHPDVLFADDFATPGSFDTGWAQEVTRTLDVTRGSTFATSYIATGTLSGADTRINIVNSTVGGGVTNPAQRRDSAHATIRFKMEPSFAGFADRVKIPAMGSQLGYWNAAGAGYWQPVTGNGGYPGTGLKVINAAAGSRVEYHGHSSRLTTGYRCSDNSAYSDYVRLATYIYHLDQVGAFPTEDTIPGLVLKRGTWYDMSHFLSLNSMSGAQDAIGNYETANPDGIYRLWINGQQVLNRTNYRWRRHAEFCVQGFWVDVYHGGTNPSDRYMYFSVNELAIASSYIGPVRPALQVSGSNWTPNVDGNGDVLPTDFEQLPINTTLFVNTNKLNDVIPSPRYGNKVGSSDGAASIVRAWCGAAVDYINHRMFIKGGGHADSHTCENGMYELNGASLRFSLESARSSLPGRRYRSTSDNAPYPANNQIPPKQWFDLTGPTDPWNDSAVEPQGLGAAAQPPASHTFWQLDYLPPSAMGNADGAVLDHFYTKGVYNLTTRQWDTPHYNFYGDGIDYSYSVVLTDGLKAFQPYGDFVMRAWDYGQRQATLWSDQLGGGATSRGAPLVPINPANSGGFFHGNHIIRNQLALLRMPERREIVTLGVQSEAVAQQKHRRLRLGQAVDATVSYSSGTSWAGYFDPLTLSSTDGSHGDFAVQANFADINAPSQPSHLFAAGCVWDDASGTAWVWGNRQDSDLYKLTGLASGNNVTVERMPSTARPLSTSFNGTFGRAMLVRRGSATCIVRVNSTTEFPQIVRVA